MPKLEEPLGLPPEQRIGVTLVGLGAYVLGQIAPNLANTQYCKRAALVTGNRNKSQTVARAYGIADEHLYSYDDFARIAEDASVDVVYVILPNAMHREWTEKAFAAGKHVLCEKPMAATSADAEAMIAAGKRAGKKLMIGYRAQYDPYNLKAIELVRGPKAELGEPRLITTEHARLLKPEDPRDQWRMKKALAGGGSLYDIGIYSLNGCRYLLGEEPTKVRACLRPPSGRLGIDVEEGIDFTLYFPSGAVANCGSSYRIKEAKRFSVQGSEAELTLDPATDYYVRNLYVSKDQEKREVIIPNTNQFAAMLDEMASAIREDRAPKTAGEEGLKDMRLMEAVYRAAETGKEVSV